MVERNTTGCILFMKYKPLLLSLALLSLVWAFYFWHFNNGFSLSQGDWGTFGDFTGGVLNPLLNFITIYLLIKSLNSQESALKHAENQYIEAKDDLKRQREEEAVRAFESSFFTFSTIALNEYSSLQVGISQKCLKSAEVITFLQDSLARCAGLGLSPKVVFEEIDENSHNGIYSLVKSFSAIFKLIIDVCPDAAKERYVGLVSTILPTKVIYLLCMAEALTSWSILKYPRELGFFEKDSVKGVLDHFKAI